ncbi:GNAT family N-acetyltransferase [Agarivorans sp. Z349TD_8]|uniref:GNAT family N-acetyltransferase n=1 Tax=Agarivorans sp. Z349TD_8 TaxID=3421434 RepID=UPI003D7EF9F2
MLFLRKPKPEDAESIKALYQASTSLHQPWSYPPSNYAGYLADEYRYFLCLTERGDIVGTFNISGVVRGYFQSAYLGYEVFMPYQGKGYMTIGIRLLLEEAFFQLKLHRLEANIQPENTSSIKLVSKAGFENEGYSKHYLNIGGFGWKDHQRWAIVNHQWSSSESKSDRAINHHRG